MPIEDAVDSAYRVLVSRVEERPSAAFWPVGLRDPLPTVPVPLRRPDADVPLDLQALLHQVYDASAYRKRAYRYEPVPPLTAADAEWAETIARRERSN